VVDNRTPDDHTARLVIWASQIAEVRTLARGKRIKSQDSINNRKHRQISRNSPLHAGAKPGDPGSLFSQAVLDHYLFGLSLHPGRRVEASIASAGDPGKVILDYLVTESKAWQVFTQINNFGSEGTGVWRARVGYQDNQLTNHDDILNVDAITTPDFKTYGSFLSYRIPVFRPAKLLARVYGSYGDFLATDTSLTDLHYAGKNWLAGIELTNRITLWRVWQLISVGGANFNHYGIQSLISETPLVSGYSDFLVPFLGTTLARDAQWWAFGGGLRVEHAMSGFANTDPTNGIPALGRIAADAEWTSLRWNITGDVFLDHWFHQDEEAPSLVHQLSMRTKGRILLRGERLIPHEEEPLGGALSVRGYPEAIVAADEFISATVEYAYHIPRGLKPGEPGTILHQPFKWRPTRPGQNPDWDLSLHAFFDYAYRSVTPAPTLGGLPAAGEGALIDSNLSMAGTGVGVALMVKQNFTLRCDYGMALLELRDDTRIQGTEVVVPKGNSQLYFVTTFSW
jgi:hemolysin activation/secretion protein